VRGITAVRKIGKKFRQIKFTWQKNAKKRRELKKMKEERGSLIAKIKGAELPPAHREHVDLLLEYAQTRPLNAVKGSLSSRRGDRDQYENRNTAGDDVLDVLNEIHGAIFSLTGGSREMRLQLLIKRYLKD
jgi:hypothetical protein